MSKKKDIEGSGGEKNTRKKNLDIFNNNNDRKIVIHGNKQRKGKL